MGQTSEVVDAILVTLAELGRLLPLPFETPYAHIRRATRIDRGYYSHSIRQLAKRGVLTVTSKHGKKFIKITRKGELEILLKKAKLPNHSQWDGKWRLVMFDIPESSKDKRQLFRLLLKANGFYKLQASVYISPYPLNRDAIEFLKRSMLIGYIRILRVDEIDEDEELLKKFNLKKIKSG